jgi:hypothetical protein
MSNNELCVSRTVLPSFHLHDSRILVYWKQLEYRKQLQRTTFHGHIYNTGCPPFREGEIQGLFQDFQGPFSVNSKT